MSDETKPRCAQDHDHCACLRAEVRRLKSELDRKPAQVRIAQEEASELLTEVRQLKASLYELDREALSRLSEEDKRRHQPDAAWHGNTEPGDWAATGLRHLAKASEREALENLLANVREHVAECCGHCWGVGHLRNALETYEQARQ